MKYPRLRAKRVELGYTQKEISKILGMDNTTYSFKERGERLFTIDEVIKIITILNCKFEDIFL